MPRTRGRWPSLSHVLLIGVFAWLTRSPKHLSAEVGLRPGIFDAAVYQLGSAGGGAFLRRISREKCLNPTPLLLDHIAGCRWFR